MHSRDTNTRKWNTLRVAPSLELGWIHLSDTIPRAKHRTVAEQKPLAIHSWPWAFASSVGPGTAAACLQVARASAAFLGVLWLLRP